MELQDHTKEIEQILNEAKKQATSIISEAKKEAEQESEKILTIGKKQSDNIKKTLISKANQEIKREIMNAQEKIIDECFIKALHELSTLDENKYVELVTKLMKDGSKKLDDKCTVFISRDMDKEIAENLGLTIDGTVESSGGIILKSSDGRVTLNHTFDGIPNRERDKIRIKVGKLLFS